MHIYLEMLSKSLYIFLEMLSLVCLIFYHLYLMVFILGIFFALKSAFFDINLAMPAFFCLVFVTCFSILLLPTFLCPYVLGVSLVNNM